MILEKINTAVGHREQEQRQTEIVFNSKHSPNGLNCV